MTFRASYFTVQPQIYRPWEQARPNYLVTVLSTVAQKPSVSVPENRPTVLAHPVDVQFPNIALLNFAQLQVHPVGGVLDETVPRPPPRPIDFQFRNVALLNFAQLQVPPVGEILDETIPQLSLRPRDFLAPNLLTIQPSPTALSPANQSFDRPQLITRQLDLLAPNLLVTTLSVAYGPSVAVWDPDPSLPVRRPDFQPPNLVVLAPAPVATPISPPALLFDKPVAVSVRTDTPLPNLLTTTLTVKPLFSPIFERPSVTSKPQDFQATNIAIAAPPLVNPFILQPFNDRPQLQRPIDFQFPNIAITTAPQVPFTNQFDGRPVAVPLRVDAPLPNLLTSTLIAIAATPRFSPIFERPVAVSHPIDAPLPNLLTTTLAVVAVKPTVQSLYAERPQRPQPPQDFVFPNIALASPLTFVFRAPLISRPQRPQPPQDLAFPNIVLFPVGPFNYTLPVGSGVYVYSGFPVGLRYTPFTPVGPGSFTVGGSDVSCNYGVSGQGTRFGFSNPVNPFATVVAETDR